MRSCSAQVACCLLLTWGQAGAGLASWDEVQLRLLESYSTPLRWDNLEGAPHWVSGPKPRYDFRQRLHLIQLQPGEEVTLRTTANRWLRLVGAERTLKAEDLEIGVSSDGWMFAEANLMKAIDPYALLVNLPEANPALVRLTRPDHAESNLVFTVYLSREEPFNTLAPLRETIRLPGESVRLRRMGEAATPSARLVEPGQDIEFSLKGPARLELVAHAQWPLGEPRGEQPLVLQVALDGADAVPLRFCPDPDTRLRTRLVQPAALVSDRQNGFLNVPEGRHHLRIQSSAPIYLSVFRQSHPDFLLPWLNGPVTNAMTWLHASLDATPDDSAWPLKFVPGPWSAGDLVRLEQQALKLSRGNQPREAGAQAGDWLKHLAQHRQDYPAAPRSARSLWRQRTVYREILPASLPGGQPLRKALFARGHLRPLFEPEPRIAVYNPTLEQVNSLLSEGHFAPVPPRLSPGLLYELPSRAHDSELRMAVLASSATRTHLLVQFDQENPIKVSLDAATTLPKDAIAASDAYATLRVLEQAVRLPARSELGLPVGEFDLKSPLLEPGVIELPLPKHVRHVRVHLREAAGPVLTSIAYRASKPFEFGEAAYLALLKDLGPAVAMRLMARAEVSPQPASEIRQELENHLLPLARRLRAHLNDFTHNVDVICPTPRSKPAFNSDEASVLKRSTLNLEEGGQLLEAIELWNRLFWEGADADHMEAALAVMRCLQSIGEEFLAEQYARYVLLKSNDQQIPAGAVALLETAAQRSHDTEKLEQLHAFLFLRCPCARHLAGLTEALVGNGQYPMALYAGMMLPRESRPVEPLLRAALQENWWQTFDELVEELGENKTRSFWRAQKHLAFYQFVEAEQELQESNELGREMLRALRQGLNIRQRLSAPAHAERFEALQAWEQWQLNQPGPKTWQTAQDVRSECFATELVFNFEQDRFTSYLRAEREKPVRFSFLGPLRLQLEVRPVLELPVRAPADDWLEVVEYGITNRIPVSQVAPNPSLQFASGRNALPGVKTLATLEYGPGWHEVDVALANAPGLVRVLQEQPVLPTRVLPSLAPHHLNLVLEGGQPAATTQSHIRVTSQSGLWWVPSDLARPKPTQDLVNWPDGTGPAQDGTDTLASLTGVERLRAALRKESKPGRPFQFDSGLLHSLPPNEQWLAACRGAHWMSFTNWTALPDSACAAGWLATGRLQQLLDLEAPRDALQRLITLLEIAELFPAWRERALCLAESLAAATNCPPGGRRILSRLTQNRTWVALKLSPLSAGIKPLQVPVDLPQDPSLRVRRALLPPARTNQFTLSGQSVFEASMVLQRPARFQVQAELAKAAFSPVLPLTLALQIDAGEVQPLSLVQSGLLASTNLLLTEGAHLVRMWIEDPVVNQFVRLTFSSGSNGETPSLWSRPLAEIGSERRFFHAATLAQPVRFHCNGPALLRVDEYREGRFLSHLRFVPDGEQVVEIPPATGCPESWYQVFVRANLTNRTEVRVATSIREPEEVPPPSLRLPESKPASQVQLTDYYRLGGQEDGTWTPGVLLAQRRPFELTDSQDAVENEFLEANVAYRKASPSETLWFKTQALGRWHRPGDLTFGLSERLEGHPQTLPFDWSWLGEAFVGTAGPQQQDVQWALHTELELRMRYQLNRKLVWYPMAGLFAHVLSLDPAEVSRYDYIDQDLYTSFRHEHRWGGVLGSQLDYQPRLDTRLEGDLYLISNENFTPDNWALRVSWTQLMGPFRGEAAYRARYFLQDADRSSASWLQGVSTGLFVEHWINGRQRVELGAEFRHDWPDSGNSCFFVLRWDFSQGRRYRDYAPRETVFRDLRNRRVTAAFNNQLQSEPPDASQP